MRHVNPAPAIVLAVAGTVPMGRGGSTHNGDINITVHQMPGENTDSLVDRIMAELTNMLHRSGLGSSLGEGIYESWALHGGSF